MTASLLKPGWFKFGLRLCGRAKMSRRRMPRTDSDIQMRNSNFSVDSLANCYTSGLLAMIPKAARFLCQNVNVTGREVISLYRLSLRSSWLSNHVARSRFSDERRSLRCCVSRSAPDSGLQWTSRQFGANCPKTKSVHCL